MADEKKPEAEEEEYESDLDDAPLPALRRAAASDDEEEEEEDDEGAPLRRRRAGSDADSDGQGAAEVYDDGEEYEEYEEVYEGFEEPGGGEPGAAAEVVDVARREGEAGGGEADEAATGEVEEEEKKSNEPYAVPTTGAFYMHDDRFQEARGRGSGRGRQRQKESRGVGGVVVGLLVELVVLAVVISEGTDLKHTIRMVARTTVMFQRNLMLTMIIPRILNMFLTMISPRMCNVLQTIIGRTKFQSCLILTMTMSITMTLFQKNLVFPTVMLKLRRMYQDLFEEESLNSTNHVGRVTLRCLQCKIMNLRMKKPCQMQTWGNTKLKLQIGNLNKFFQLSKLLHQT